MHCIDCDWGIGVLGVPRGWGISDLGGDGREGDWGMRGELEACAFAFAQKSMNSRCSSAAVQQCSSGGVLLPKWCAIHVDVWCTSWCAVCRMEFARRHMQAGNVGKPLVVVSNLFAMH